MRYSITYTSPQKPQDEDDKKAHTTFYTEDKEAVRKLVQSGLNKGFSVTTRIVTDAP